MMDTVFQILLLVIGLCLTVFGADALVDGASSIAKRLGISDFVIGLTVVGFGTSCPELVVSVTGALQGNADIAVGNVLGSNIMNTMMILGLTALLYPIAVTESNRKLDIPLNMFVVLLFMVSGYSLAIAGIGDNVIGRLDGAVYLLLFAAYLYMCFRAGRVEDEDEPSEKSRVMRLWVALLYTIGGLAALVLGGRLFVDSATAIARILGVSDKFIAITVLAGGTSLPELATCIVAAAKHKEQLALGNILGSNVFNILLILGLASLITPLSLASIDMVDMLVLAASAVLLMVFTFTGRRDRIDRFEGFVFLAAYIAYMVYLFSRL